MVRLKAHAEVVASGPSGTSQAVAPSSERWGSTASGSWPVTSACEKSRRSTDLNSFTMGDTGFQNRDLRDTVGEEYEAMSFHDTNSRIMINHPHSPVVAAFLCLAGACASPTPEQVGAGNSDSLDVATIQRILGREGALQEGQFKVTIPQNDLDVTVDGFSIVPPMGLGSWIAFTPAPDGAVIMGDVVVREDEIGPVQHVLLNNGLTVTGLHNHFVRENPNVMYMHVGGEGTEEAMARAVEAVFARVAELRGGDPARAPSRSVPNTIDTTEIARILGHAGAMSGGVYKVTIGRPDVALRAHRVPVTSFMGFNTWAAWQGTPERAAVAGDFAMREDEVAPVIQALVEHGIEVVAVHNHMVQEYPRIVFLHYWGVGPAPELARGLKAALDRTGNDR